MNSLRSPPSNAIAGAVSQKQPKLPKQKVPDSKWESLKGKIYQVYVEENHTLEHTMQTIQLSDSITASARTWKTKLKEWGFDKNVSAVVMAFIVARLEQRSEGEGKQTVVFLGNTQITSQRIENFQKKNPSKVFEVACQSSKKPIPEAELDTSQAKSKADFHGIYPTEESRFDLLESDARSSRSSLSKSSGRAIASTIRLSRSAADVEITEMIYRTARAGGSVHNSSKSTSPTRERMDSRDLYAEFSNYLNSERTECREILICFIDTLHFSSLGYPRDGYQLKEPTPEVLLGALRLAAGYSALGAFDRAEILFSSLFDTGVVKYSSGSQLLKSYGYMEYAIHHIHRGTWDKSIQYFELANRSIEDTERQWDTLSRLLLARWPSHQPLFPGYDWKPGQHLSNAFDTMIGNATRKLASVNKAGSSWRPNVGTFHDLGNKIRNKKRTQALEDPSA